jgi:putative ABC transport system permease protein
MIACLGLFGLASFIAERKTKEVGIRKVLGTSVPGIVKIMNTNFVKWVLIANLNAWPMAWYVMNKWLQNFA